MLFVILCDMKEGTTRDVATTRRLEFQFPEGIKIVGEYWLEATKPQVVLIAEADSVAPMMAATRAWDDLYEFKVYPAVTAKEGLEIAKQMGVKQAMPV